MKQAALTLHRFTYKLPEPLSIATYTWTHIETILVKLHYDHFVGIGEATPFPIMTGETYDYVLSQLQDFKRCVIDPNADPEIFYQQLQNNISSCHAAAALDGAFHDLIGKMRNKPVYQLFGNTQNFTLNSLTLPILGVEETKQFALNLLEKHPQLQLIKLKINNTGMNTEIAKAIKDVFSEKVSFVIDPNQCFKESQEAVEVLQEMQAILGRIVVIEQPVEKQDYQGLLHVKNKLNGINIYADESVATMDDLERIIKMNAVDGINIKIQKAGGIWNARKIAQRSAEAGLKIMVGCMMEGPIGIAAGIHFAVSTANVLFTDLDSDLFLFQDLQEPVFSTSLFSEGRRLPFEKPGLGIEIHEEAMIKLTKENKVGYEEI